MSVCIHAIPLAQATLFPTLSLSLSLESTLLFLSLSQTRRSSVDLNMATPMVEDNFEDDTLSSMSTDDVTRASRLLDNEIRILKVSLPISLWRNLDLIII